MSIGEPPTSKPTAGTATHPLPKISPQISGFFSWFLPWYLRRNFHVVALLRRHSGRGRLALPADQPVIIALNHPSWWDPLIGLFFTDRCFDGRQFYAPIDAAALANYRIFEKLGFYGVDLETPAGAKAFLETSRAILDSDTASLWITPEGRFTDVREDAEFAPGLGHLLSRADRGVVVPLAAEYTFWEEKLPVALAAFGDPIAVSEHQGLSKDAWTELVRTRLRETQAELSAASIARDPAAFEPVVTGKVGVGGPYEWGRRLKAWWKGEDYDPQHGEKFRAS